MNILAIFLSGILTAFTPCVIILIPALVYRFSQEKTSDILKQGGLFIASFLGMFILAGGILDQVLDSTFKYGFQLGVGILFVVLGILALKNKFNPLQFPLIKNPILFGLVFAIVTAINPCTFAYVGIISTISTNMLATLLVFALGLLLPSIVFLIFGTHLIAKIKKAVKVIHYVNLVMNILLIGMGIYLILTIQSFGFADVIITSILLLLTFIVILRSYYVFSNKKTLLTIRTALLFLALIGIIIASIIHCNHFITTNTDPSANSPFLEESNNQQPTCNQHQETCQTCNRCKILFSISVIIGFLAVFFEQMFKEKYLD
ncbi:MAG: cytochrome c biogenesis protein CcdA [Nanobdellota archaeon]